MGVVYNTSIVRDGLVLHLDAANIKSYPGSGTVWSDLSKNFYTSSLQNGTTKSNNYMSFDGVNDYVSLGSISGSNKLMLNNPENGGLTFSFAIYWNGTGATYQRIIDKSTSGSGTSGYAVWIEPTGTTSLPYCMVYRTNGASVPNAILESSTPMPTNKWVIWTFTHNVSTGACSWYRDGVLDVSGTQTYSIPNATALLNIGNWYTTGTSRFFNGRMGYISIYDKSLSANEIKQNFEATRSRYGI